MKSDSIEAYVITNLEMARDIENPSNIFTIQYQLSIKNQAYQKHHKISWYKISTLDQSFEKLIVTLTPTLFPLKPLKTPTNSNVNKINN